MNAPELPPLPIGTYATNFYDFDLVYTKEQLHQYAITALSARASAGEGGVVVPRTLLEKLLKRDEFDGACRCINHSRNAEREYESGECPHQRLAELLTAAPQPAQAGASGGGEDARRKAYDMIDHYLRNSLMDSDYAEYSEALETVFTTPASPATGEGKEKLVPDWSRAYQRDGQTFVPMQPAATPQPESARGGLSKQTIEAVLSEVLDENGDSLSTGAFDEIVSRLTVRRRMAEADDLAKGGEFAQGKAAGIRAVLADLHPNARGGGEAEDCGERDSAVWTLIDLAEKCGAKKDSDDNSTWWTLDVHAFYALEEELCARNINAGWPRPATPPAHGDGEGVKIDYITAFNFAKDNGLDYNRLCAAVREMVTTRPTPEAQEVRDGVDARRYRYLRDHCKREWYSDMPHNKGAPSLDIEFEARGHDLDAAIDAALALPAQGREGDRG